MLVRVVAFALLLAIARCGFAQVALPASGVQLLKSNEAAGAAPDNAWIDLRQNSATHSKPQAAPSWVESVTFTPARKDSDAAKKSVFRIRLTKPNDDCQILLFRLYFEDLPEAQPELIAWDESGTQLIRSGPLGQKTGLAYLFEHDRPDDRSERDRRRSAGRRTFRARSLLGLDEIEPGDAPIARCSTEVDGGLI